MQAFLQIIKRSDLKTILLLAVLITSIPVDASGRLQRSVKYTLEEHQKILLEAPEGSSFLSSWTAAIINAVAGTSLEEQLMEGTTDGENPNETQLALIHYLLGISSSFENNPSANHLVQQLSDILHSEIMFLNFNDSGVQGFTANPFDGIYQFAHVDSFQTWISTPWLQELILGSALNHPLIFWFTLQQVQTVITNLETQQLQPVISILQPQPRARVNHPAIACGSGDIDLIPPQQAKKRRNKDVEAFENKFRERVLKKIKHKPRLAEQLQNRMTAAQTPEPLFHNPIGNPLQPAAAPARTSLPGQALKIGILPAITTLAILWWFEPLRNQLVESSYEYSQKAYNACLDALNSTGWLLQGISESWTKETKLPEPGACPNDHKIVIPEQYRQYITRGEINGLAVDMLVDTGATDVSMSDVVARRVGIHDYRTWGEQRVCSTANGDIYCYRVKGVTVGLGCFSKTVTVSVRETGREEEVLLGMSFFKRFLEIRYDGEETMIIKKADVLKKDTE